MNKPLQFLKPLFIIFLLVNILVFALKSFLEMQKFDISVLLGANALFFLMAVLVFFMQQKAIRNTNPNVFVRSIIAGMMLKMFGTVIAVLVYVLMSDKNYNKRSVFLALLIYLLYLGGEAASIMKLNRKVPHG